jgi:hypothetical protein
VLRRHLGTTAHGPATGKALAHRPDPLHLAVVFDPDPKTAIRHASVARHLLETSIKCDTRG